MTVIILNEWTFDKSEWFVFLSAEIGLRERTAEEIFRRDRTFPALCRVMIDNKMK